jgi:trigger factor
MMIEIGMPETPPAFDEGLRGATAGARLSLAVDYPPGEGGHDLAGKHVDYRVHVHEVKVRRLPEIDDDFARDLGDFANVEALKSRLRQDLARNKDRQAEQQLRQALLDKLLLQNPVLLPEVLVEQEIARRLEDLVRGLMLQGVDPEKVEFDWKELRRREEGPARRAVHARLMLDALARAEALSVSDEDVESAIEREARRIGKSVDELRSRLQKQGALAALKSQILREKSLDYLTAVANIQVGE